MKIKYRAFYKPQKKMCRVKELILHEDEKIGEALENVSKVEPLLSEYDYRDVDVKNKDFVLMAWTGHQDQYGKDIYEGDELFINGEEEIAIVEWDKETARFIIICDNIIYDFDSFWDKELTVIGNIYQE